jgi:hypothetical protein
MASATPIDMDIYLVLLEYVAASIARKEHHDRTTAPCIMHRKKKRREIRDQNQS